MSFLNKLKSLIHIEKGIDLSGLQSIHLEVNIGSKNKSYVIKEQKLTIQVDETKKDQLGKLINEAFNKEGQLLLESGTNNLLEDFQDIDAKQSTQNLLNFFRGKIPPSDLEALRASLYLRELHLKRENRDLIHKVKQDIIGKYGERGRNIANLCTAGYFESILEPLYTELSSQPDFISEKFKTRYEKIVMQYPFAVFVNRTMTDKALILEIEQKIKRNKKYGIRKLNIHAIGTNNVEKVSRALKSLERYFSQQPDMDSEQGYTTVTIWF